MLKKGMRVCCKHGKYMVYGIVLRGGAKRVEMVVDGGETSLSGPSGAFELSKHPLPKDPPNLMDNWEVKQYREQKGHDDSQPFHALIYHQGKKVLEAYNDGWGGSNVYQPIQRARGDKCRAQLENDCREWAALFGEDEPFEIIDTWIAWYVYERPYGVTANTLFHRLRTASAG